MTATSIQPNTTNEPKQTTLYYREGSSDKLYQVSLEANGSPSYFLVRFAFGRRGATLQTGTKTPAPVDYDTALRTFNQLVASKVAKGYSPGQDGSPYQHAGNEGRSTGIYPQLLTAVEDEHDLGHLMLDPLYCVQEKHDGKRLMIRKTGHTVEGINRKGLLVSVSESIACEMKYLAGDCLLDGEAVGDTLHVFDVLETAWTDVRALPYVDRLHRLYALLTCVPNRALVPVCTAWSSREKISLLERLRRQNKEGIVLKLLTAPYTPGKTSGSQDQLKYKLVESASFVVTQVHPTKRSVSLGMSAMGPRRVPVKHACHGDQVCRPGNAPTSSLQVKFTPVRVVCQNTLTLAINNGSGIKISHHTDIHQRLKAAEKMLGIVRHQFDELADTFREMVQVPMNHNRLERYLEYVFPEPKDRLPTESEAECITRDRSWSRYFFDQGAGNRMKGVEGTLWASYNGVTEYLDHRKIRQNADQRLTSAWFGEANRVKARALTVAVEMLPHFRN